jgi:imidazolonepropionase-like amidohydrolase
LVIDGTDRYLMPGLSEMHGHIPDLGSDSLERVLHLYLANGITLVRGMLGQPSHLRLRQEILDGSVLGPRLITSGPSFNGHSVQSPSQAQQMVHDQYQAGYDFLKIHPGLSQEEFDAIAAMAGKLGIPFAGHVSADVGIERALAAGIASIDHLDGYMQSLLPAHEDPSGGFEGFFGLLLADQAEPAKIAAIVAATRRANVWNVPTQSLFVNVVSGAAASDMSAWPEMRYMPAVTVQQWAKSKNDVVTDDAYRLATATRAIDIRRQIIRALQDSGAGLLLGSDSPQIFNVPGFSIHRELQHLVDAGLTPYEALLTGTVNPARFFGRAGVSGTVEIGRAADLVLLDANPLADISATRRVHGVMLRGRWVSKSDITALLDAMKR